MKKIIAIILFAFSGSVLAAGGGGGPTPFIPLNPPIVVNIIDGDRIRHMQVMIEMHVKDFENSEITNAINLHKGPIRHELILLLSTQDISTVSSALGKEDLRKEALSLIQNKFKELAGKPLIDNLYFTNFIIQ